MNPILHDLFDQLNVLKNRFPNKKIVIYCFRGGMRSRSFCGAMNMMGINCSYIKGGYDNNLLYNNLNHSL